MIHPAVHVYRLDTDCPVKWTATQEKSLARDFPVELTDESPEAYASRTYQQFLWFPESITPLHHFIPALLRANSGGISPSSSDPADVLRRALQTLLLTPRAAAHKYQEHIPRLLVDEEAVPDLEAHLLWYAVKYEKVGFEEDADETQQEQAEEKWKNAWLERVERREALIQIILHFLILTRPEPPPVRERDPSPDPLPPSQSPRKRKRKVPPSDSLLPNSDIEDQLETFMDKLCMWQLTSALDNIAGSNTSTNQRSGISSSSKQKAADERDWMQKFCEDLIEPFFKSVLPSHCALLRTKVFPNSPFSDGSDTDDLPAPSNERSSKRSRVSGSTSSSRRQSPARQSHIDASDERSLSRSRSLSVSLEQERARSRSLSIGPGQMKKRALAREVSMTTVFKGKAQEQARRKEERARTARTAKKPAQQVTRPKKDHGKTLVEATPVKPKGRDKVKLHSSQKDATKLPMLSVKEESEEENWQPLDNSPDILLLGSSSSSWSDDDEVVDPEAFGTPIRRPKASRSRVLVGATPTKAS